MVGLGVLSVCCAAIVAPAGARKPAQRCGKASAPDGGPIVDFKARGVSCRAAKRVLVADGCNSGANCQVGMRSWRCRVTSEGADSISYACKSRKAVVSWTVPRVP